MSKVAQFPDRTLKKFKVYVVATSPLIVVGRFVVHTDLDYQIWLDDDAPVPVLLIPRDSCLAIRCLGPIKTTTRKKK